jgi:hypothetical protein
MSVKLAQKNTGGIPYTDSFVQASACYVRTVGTESNACYPIIMSAYYMDKRAVNCPKPDYFILAAGNNMLAVGTKPNAQKPAAGTADL